MANNIRGITVEIGGSTAKLTKALADVNSKSRELQSELNSVNKLLKLDPTNTELLSQKQKILSNSIDETNNKLNQLKSYQSQIKKQYDNKKIDEGAYRAFQREIVATEEKLKSLQKQEKQFGNVLSQQIKAKGEELSNFGNKIEAVGKNFSLISTAATGVLAGSTATAANFEDAMLKVSAISGATGDEFEKLKAKAEEMGIKTKFSASESAEALQYMAMAGWKTNDMVDGLEGIMNLAAASGEDLALTSDIVTDALTAFGMKANESGHFADILAAASSNSNTNVAMMGETFKYAASIAGSLGYSAEDTALAIGLMANSGIKASQAGTSLRSIMSRIATDTNGAREAMEHLGVKVVNSDGSMRNFGEVIADLRPKFQALTEEEQANYAKTIAGQNALSGFLAIANSGDEDFKKLSSAINDCSGTSQDMANTMNSGLKGQLTLLKSQIEGIAIQLGNILIPIFQKLVSKVADVLTWFSELNDGTKKVIVTILGLIAGIAPVLIIIGKIINGFGKLISFGSKIIDLIAKAKKSISPLTLALVAMISGIAMIITNLAGLITNWDKLDAKQKLIKAGFVALGAAIVAFGYSIAAGFSVATLGIGALIAAITVVITSIVSLISKFSKEKDAIMETKDAQEKLTRAQENAKKAQDDLTNATSNYIHAVDNAEDAAKRLKEAEKKNRMSGAELQKQVENGTLSYETMNKKQREVYKAYLDNDQAQKDLKKSQEEVTESTKILTDAKKEETLASFDNQLAIAAESGNYDEYKNSVVTAYNEGKIRAAEARDAIEKSMSRMSDASQKTFVEDLPDDIKEGLDPDKYQTTSEKFSNWFETTADKIKSAFVDIPKFFIDLGKDIVSGLTGGIEKNWVSVENSTKKVSNKLVEAAKNSLKISSPSKVMKEIGYFTSEGLAIGIEEKGTDASNAMDNVIKNVVSKTSQTALIKLGVNTPNNFNSTGTEFDKKSSSNTKINQTGDTFNFYSPEPLTPSECARQIRKETRQRKILT